MDVAEITQSMEMAGDISAGDAEMVREAEESRQSTTTAKRHILRALRAWREVAGEDAGRRSTAVEAVLSSARDAMARGRRPRERGGAAGGEGRGMQGAQERDRGQGELVDVSAEVRGGAAHQKRAPPPLYA